MKYLLGFLGAALVLSQATPVQAELVLDDQATSDNEAATDVQSQENAVEQREATRRTIHSAEKAKITRAENAAHTESAIDSDALPIQDSMTITTMPAAAAPVASSRPVEALSRNEILRRERQRQEYKTEDLLQTRLEQIRLREEQRRLQKVMKSSAMLLGEEEPRAKVETAAPETLDVSEPKLVAANQDTITTSQAGVSSASAETTLAAPEEKTMILVSPRAGVPNMSGPGIYEVSGRYSVGVGLGVVASDNLSIEAGYSFNEYGLSVPTSNGLLYGFQQANLRSNETVAMKQNVFELGAKLHLLAQDSKVRPYISGGGGYSKAFVNYDRATLDALRQSNLTSLTTDYEVSSFLGYLGAGLDVRVSKSVSVGASFKYYKAFSTRENYPFNTYAAFGNGLYNGYGFNPGYYNPGLFGNGLGNGGTDADKVRAGSSVAGQDFYTVTGGLTFTF